MAGSKNGDRSGDSEAERYRHLPEPIRLADTITSQETAAPPDPTMGRDTEQDFMLRFAG